MSTLSEVPKQDVERLREDFHRAIVAGAMDGILTLDGSNNILDLNPAAERIFGYPLEELKNQPLSSILPPNGGAGCSSQYCTVGVERVECRGCGTGSHLKAGGIVETCGLRKSGGAFPVEVGLTEVSHAGEVLRIVVVRDITERRENEVRIRKLAEYDPLTGLPNRAHLAHRLPSLIAETKAQSRLLAVMFIDLDNFKDVNDTLGHHTGDALLRQAALRLKSCVRDTDMVARLGGDEFAVIQAGITHVDAAELLAKRIVTQLAEPFMVDGNRLHVTASIGITFSPFHEDQAEQLLQYADLAMYHAKECGKNQYAFFDFRMLERVQIRKSVELQIREALENNQYRLFYQPQMDLATGRVCGVEALIRWVHPTAGLIPPDQFIHIAEASGLIVPMGEWVIREACQQIKRWDSEGLVIPLVSVNASTIQFRDKAFADTVLRVLYDEGVNPKRLELEITESVMMHQAESLADEIGKLRQAGVRIAVDDFGSGYSSFGYLLRFSVDKIKIDRSFIFNLEHGSSEKTLARGIIAFTKGLGIRVNAEGIERKSQHDYLKQHGCDEIQGYWFGKPMQAGAMTDFVAKHGVVTKLCAAA